MARAAIAALLVALAGIACGTQQASGPRLVLVVVFDAASAAYFGAWGDPHGATPHVDRLAAEGAVFENASAPSVTTSPSVASLLTGVRSTHHGMTSDAVLPPRWPTLPGELRAQGFQTLAVVANPMAAAPELGLHRGYDEMVRVYAHEGEKPVPVAIDDRYRSVTPEDVNRSVEALLPRVSGRDTFLMVHYLQPHEPYDPPAEYLALFPPAADEGWQTLSERRRGGKGVGTETVARIEARYRANLRWVDDAFGALRARLEEAGLWDEALVVLLSDHGEAFNGHGYFGHNKTLYEDMVHVPLVMRVPGSEPRRVAAPVELVDVTASVLAWAGAPLPPGIHGENLLPLARGERTEPLSREVVMATMHHEQRALRVGSFKLIVKPDRSQELYDLSTDPDERHDVLRRNRGRAKKLRRQLAAAASTAGPLPPRHTLAADARMRPLLEELGYVESEEDTD